MDRLRSWDCAYSVHRACRCAWCIDLQAFYAQATPCNYTTYLAAASSNTLTGGATPRALNGSASVVGNIGYSGTLAFMSVDGGASGGMKVLSLSYVNADYTFSNTNCSNCRRAEVSVNEGTPVAVEMPISGQVRVWPCF